MKRYVGLTALLLMAGFSACYGASFDCALAKTRSERLICSDLELSKLDSALANAYKKRIGELKDAKYLRNQQRDWLQHVRDRCFDGKCIKLVYQNRLTQLDAIPSDELDNCAITPGIALTESYCLSGRIKLAEQLLASQIDVLALSRKMTTTQATAFRERQAVWRKDLDCHCSEELHLYNTGGGFVYTNCLLPEFEKRVNELNAILNGDALDHGGISPRTCKGIKESREATP